MFTDEELGDLLMALDMATLEVESPLTPYGIEKFTALRNKVQAIRDTAPNKACTRLKLLVGKIIRFCKTRFSGLRKPLAG